MRLECKLWEDRFCVWVVSFPPLFRLSLSGSWTQPLWSQVLCQGCREGKTKPLITGGSPHMGPAMFGFVSTKNQAMDDCFMLRFLSQFPWKPFFTFNGVVIDTLSMLRAC